MSPATAVRPEPYWLIAAALVVGDQLIKLLVQGMSQPITFGPVSIGPVINREGVLGLDLSNDVLIGAGVLICLGLLVLLSIDVQRAPARLGVWLIIGGAFSNTVDRILQGGVVDVISIAGWSWFNLADVMILLGALALLRSIWWKGEDARGL